MGLFSSNSLKPMIAFKGVRSSWLMTARNVDLAALASSACCRATSTSWLAELRSRAIRYCETDHMTKITRTAAAAAIVCGSQVASLPPDSLAAIDGWVRRGGRLVFAAGESAPTISAGSSRAADWLPGAGPRLVPLKRFGAIEAYARAGGLAARVPAAGIEVPRFEGKEGIAGVVDAFEGTTAADLPLVVRRAHGLGTITWIGIDIDQPWCADWPGCDRLVAALLGGREEQETTRAADAISRVPDLAGQLRVGLETFVGPGAASRAVPF